MSRIKIFFLFFFVSFFLCVALLPAQPDQARFRAFSDRVMAQLQSADFESVFKLFYLPEALTSKELRREKENVVFGLREILGVKMGVPVSFSVKEGFDVGPASRRVLVADIRTGFPEKKMHLGSVYVVYRTTFAKGQDGVVLIGIFVEEDNLYLKQIMIELPPKDPSSSTLARDFKKFMASLSEKQRQRDAFLISAD